MELTGITPILNVADVPASIEWFARLGWTPSFTYNDSGMIAGATVSNEHGPAQLAGICCGEARSFSAGMDKDRAAGRRPAMSWATTSAAYG